MDAGASIIGFVGFGLTCIKTLYQFVSSVKDGPEKVRDFPRALASLQAAYERTESFADLPGIMDSSPSLVQLLQRCNEDVARLGKKIGKLGIQPRDKFHENVWKRLKTALGEDDIAYALDVISGYVDAFTLEISLIDLRLSHRNSSGISQILTEGERQFTIMQKQHTTLAKIGEDVFRSVSQIQQVHEIVNMLAVKAANVPSMSSVQSTGITDRLAELEEQIARMRLRTVYPDAQAEEKENQARNENSEVALSIQRLCSLVGRQEHVAESDEAQEILDDLDTVLRDLAATGRRFEPSAPGKDISSGPSKRDVRQIRGILNSSSELFLNNESTEQRMSVIKIFGGKTSGRFQTRTLHQNYYGTWTISNQRRWRHCITNDGEKELEDNVTRLLFRPRSRRTEFVIKASVRQLQQIHGFYSLTPIVSISRIRPRTSRVFNCIREGSLDELLQLLATGKASLQDRDDLGTPLIHYAYGQPEICKFLIDNGAEVDEVVYWDHIQDGNHWLYRDNILALITRTPLYTNLQRSVSEKCLQAFKYLLQAGADPTLGTLVGSDSLVAFNFPPPRGWKGARQDFALHLKSIFELGGAFFDVNEIDRSGFTMLHHCCMNSATYTMRALLKYGAKVDARDYMGRTCLQYLMSQVRVAGRMIEADQESLRLFINSGADITCRDNGDRSIWDTALENQRQGSYERDLWDSVLACSDYHSEVEAFSRDHTRHAVYTNWYTRDLLERLWEGKEHLCPYFNDEAQGLDRASFVPLGWLSDDSSDSDSQATALEELESSFSDSESEGFEDQGMDARNAPMPGTRTSAVVSEEQNELSDDGSSQTDGGNACIPTGIQLGQQHESYPEQTAACSTEEWVSNSTSPERSSWGSLCAPKPEPSIQPTFGSGTDMADEVFQNPWVDG